MAGDITRHFDGTADTAVMERWTKFGGRRVQRFRK
jgi:hypothetical protein